MYKKEIKTNLTHIELVLRLIDDVNKLTKEISLLKEKEHDCSNLHKTVVLYQVLLLIASSLLFAFIVIFLDAGIV
jgi:hypothetical protein